MKRSAGNLSRFWLWKMHLPPVSKKLRIMKVDHASFRILPLAFWCKSCLILFNHLEFSCETYWTNLYIYCCTNALYSPAITSGIFPNPPHYRFNIVKTLLFQCLRHQTLNGKICCRHRGRIAWHNNQAELEGLLRVLQPAVKVLLIKLAKMIVVSDESRIPSRHIQKSKTWT